MFAARHLGVAAVDVVRALRRRHREVWPLRRRGADLGFAVVVDRTPPTPGTALARWRAGEPVYLPDVLGDRVAQFAAPITASLRMFDRLRAGGSFLTEIERRIGDDKHLRYAGSMRDADDAREIERVLVDAEVDGEVVAQDLWVKLAWIAGGGGGDRSLRLRFSCGQDELEHWMTTTELAAGWADQFAARAFPECAAILDCKPLRQQLEALLQRPHRLSERIVYNNSPNGGAVFHHDAEPSQLGVVFTQLEGHTAWLSLPKRRLARVLVRSGRAADERRAMRALDDGDERLQQCINRDAAFTAHLAAHGALFVLQAGDSIVLPSHSIDEVAWHSVIALGKRASLAHSYGLFGSSGLAAHRRRR